MKSVRLSLFLIFSFCFHHLSIAQGIVERITGDFYLTSQYYVEDEEISATKLPGGQSIGLNSALSLNYNWKNLSAGFRYEAYLPPLLGFETQLEGQGFGNAFITYQYKKLEVTLGSFYEQFGSGMILR